MIFPDRNLHSFAMSQLAMFDQRVRPALTLALRPPIFIQLFGACSCWLSEVNSAHQRRPLRPLRKLWLRNRPSHVSLGLLNTLSSKRLADPTLIWGILTTLLSPKKKTENIHWPIPTLLTDSLAWWQVLGRVGAFRRVPSDIEIAGTSGCSPPPKRIGIE